MQMCVCHAYSTFTVLIYFVACSSSTRSRGHPPSQNQRDTPPRRCPPIRIFSDPGNLSSQGLTPKSGGRGPGNRHAVGKVLRVRRELSSRLEGAAVLSSPFYKERQRGRVWFSRPQDVLRAAHVLPGFRFGRTRALLPSSLARKKSENDEDRAYYHVNM